MNKPRCPDPERLALLVEDRLGRTARARVLRHAADCPSCRRQLAISSLTPTSPFRAAVDAALNSGKLTVAAGVLLGILVLRFLGSGAEADPAPPVRVVRATPPRTAALTAPPKPDAPRVLQVSALPRRPAAEAEVPAPVEDLVINGPIVGESEPVPATAARTDFTTAVLPPRLDPAAAAPAPPPPGARAVEVETFGRLVILDPFGGLALEGTGGRSAVLGSRVVPVEGRLTAVGRSSGFRLGDGLRVQLAPGSSVSVFQNLTRRCTGLAVLQGALLVESTQPQSLFLRREENSGMLEGMNGPVLVNAGTKADAVTVTPMGTSPVVWRRAGQAPLEIPVGDTLGLETNAQDLTARGSKPRPSLARFVSWPELSSLFFSSFEDDVQGMERPTVVQGTSKEGYVASAAGGRGRKTIEIALPASLQSLPADAVIRLRVRTTATRIQFGIGGSSGRTVPVIVAQRNRSDTAWTAVSVSLAALDQDYHRGRGGGPGSKQGLRGNLTFSAEAPSRISAEELVFDVDEIEISRT